MRASMGNNADPIDTESPLNYRMAPLARAGMRAPLEPTFGDDAQTYASSEQRHDSVVAAPCRPIPKLGPGLHLGPILGEYGFLDIAKVRDRYRWPAKALG